MKYLNAWDKYCKLVWVPSFVMEMAISVGPDQTAPLKVSFDQGLHCLIRPVCLNTCWVLAGCMPHCFVFVFFVFVFFSHYYL